MPACVSEVVRKGTAKCVASAGNKIPDAGTMQAQKHSGSEESVRIVCEHPRNSRNYSRVTLGKMGGRMHNGKVLRSLLAAYRRPSALDYVVHAH